MLLKNNVYTSYTYIDGGVFKRKGYILLGNLQSQALWNHCNVNYNSGMMPTVAMGMLLYTLNTKTEPESDPPILVLHKFPLFQLFYKSYDILEVPQVVFICLEINEIPW